MSKKKFEYELQNNLAVDMCAACFFHYAKQARRVEVIHLRPRLFAMFREWAAKNFGDEAAEAEEYSFMRMTIKKGSELQVNDLREELAPLKTRAEALN